MKLLNLVKTEPNQTTQFLIDALSEGKGVTRWNLYENTDYDKLVAEVFAHDEVISWW